jgi:hypothetical protein
VNNPTYYDLDGSVCSEERAVELIKDLTARTVARTEMEIAGRPVVVSTVFTIVDQMPMLYNVVAEAPYLWVTEAIGGPDDIDATFQFASSHDDAAANHELMVERMIVSGCDPVG